MAKSTVDKYRAQSRQTPSPTWKAFLKNHINDVVSIDFFIVPTIRFKLLFVLVVLALAPEGSALQRHRESDCSVDRQQIGEAFPWDSAPKYLLRDQEAIYGGAFQERTHGVGFEQVVSAPRSPWQTPFVQRLIGTLRRGCLDQSSPLTSITSGASSRDISITTTTGERTSRYRWTRRIRKPCIR